MFDYTSYQKGTVENLLSFITLKIVFVVTIIFLLFCYIFFGRTITRNIDVLVSSDYAPYFDLQRVSEDKWSLEIREQAKKNSEERLRKEREILARQAIELMRQRIQNNGNTSSVPTTISKSTSSSDFSFRREQPNAGALLLKCNWTEMIFLYDPNTRQMSLSTSQKWNASTGEIADIPQPYLSLLSSDGNYRLDSINVGQRGASVLDDRVKYWSHICGGQTSYDCVRASITTYGRFGWAAVLSPDNSKWAVLSIDGPVYGGGGALISSTLVHGGLRYVEIFELVQSQTEKPQFRKIGKTIKIYDPIESTKLNWVWSSDGQFIIVTAYDGTTISIVNINDFTK